MHLRLEKSIEKEFYFESLFILSSLVENQTKKQAKNQIKTQQGRLSFEESINIIYSNKIINEETSNRLHEWRETRNDIVHHLITDSTHESHLFSVIKEGKDLLKILEENNI